MGCLWDPAWRAFGPPELRYNLWLEDVTSADFENSVYAFGQSADIVSLMYTKLIKRLEDNNGTAVSFQVGLNAVRMELWVIC